MTINERLKELEEKDFMLKVKDHWEGTDYNRSRFIGREMYNIKLAIQQGRGEEEYSEEEFHEKDYKVDYSKGYVNIGYIEIMADY